MNIELNITNLSECNKITEIPIKLFELINLKRLKFPNSKSSVWKTKFSFLKKLKI